MSSQVLQDAVDMSTFYNVAGIERGDMSAVNHPKFDNLPASSASLPQNLPTLKSVSFPNNDSMI